MTFLLEWSIKTENRAACLQRCADSTVEDEVPAGVNLLGRWHDLNNWSGFAIFEAEDDAAILSWTLQWTDLCDVSVRPVVDDQTSKGISRSFLSQKQA